MTAMTTSQLRTIITTYMEAWNAHDVDAILGFLTDDVVWEEPGAPQTTIGKAAVAQSLKNVFMALPDVHFPLDDLWIYISDDPSYAAASYTMIGTMTGRLIGFAPTGKSMRVRGTCLYELRDGKIAKHTIIYDAVDAMQQLGVLPSYGSLAFKAQGAVQNVGIAVRDLIKH